VQSAFTLKELQELSSIPDVEISLLQDDLEDSFNGASIAEFQEHGPGQIVSVEEACVTCDQVDAGNTPQNGVSKNAQNPQEPFVDGGVSSFEQKVEEEDHFQVSVITKTNPR
jgi:hypothetical protein